MERYNGGIPETVQNGRVPERSTPQSLWAVPNVKRPANPACFVHGYPPDALRRDGLAPAILQQAGSPPVAERCGTVRTEFLILPATLRKASQQSQHPGAAEDYVDSRRHSRKSAGSGSHPDGGVNLQVSRDPRIRTDAGIVSQRSVFAHY